MATKTTTHTIPFMDNKNNKNSKKKGCNQMVTKLLKYQINWLYAFFSRNKIIAASTAALTLCMATILFFVFAGRGIETRIIEIFSVDGPDVNVTRGEALAITASAGIWLHDGYGVLTGKESICHILLDTDSLIRMDAQSEISISRASATALAIHVKNGQILIDVQEQYPGHDLEVLIGNFAIGVRGTLFIAGNINYGEAQIIMLEGIVYVDDEEHVSAGYVMNLRDEEPLEALPLTIEDLDRFAMQAILDYRDRVLEAGAITQEELDWIERLMDVPDYIWIQGIQISTRITELHLVYGNFFVREGMENVYHVRLSSEEMELLKYMVFLKELRLYNQNISNVEALSELSSLKELSMSSKKYYIPYVGFMHGGGQINDITPLVNLTNLTLLYLRGNQIENLTSLNNLINLRHLYLASNQINDIAPLENLTGLISLCLSNNYISNLAPLNKLVNLTHLSVTGNHITNISPLSSLVNLTYLAVFGNQVTDIAPLSKLVNLTSLIVTGNQITDISPLTYLTNLTRLSIEVNQIADISPLAYLLNLRELSITTWAWPDTNWELIYHIDYVNGRDRNSRP